MEPATLRGGTVGFHTLAAQQYLSRCYTASEPSLGILRDALTGTGAQVAQKVLSVMFPELPGRTWATVPGESPAEISHQSTCSSWPRITWSRLLLV